MDLLCIPQFPIFASNMHNKVLFMPFPIPTSNRENFFLPVSICHAHSGSGVEWNLKPGNIYSVF